MTRADDPRDPGDLVAGARRAEVATPADADAALPVVARLVVEVRSDGRRTIARGAMEDAASGQTVAVEARGDSPLQLAAALARSMFRVPSLARAAARAAAVALLPGRRRR